MKNKRLALRLLANDCQIAALYLVGKKTCAIGCLALASGVNEAELKEHNGKTVGCTELAQVRRQIWEKFRLSDTNLRHIQYANDNHDEIIARRETVLDCVRRIKAS